MTASPLSTGGAGPDFETEVGVYYLAALLCGSAFRGGPPGGIERLGFQRAVTGALLDDIVFETDVAGVRVRTELQLKRTLSLTKSDSEFVDVMRACWRALHMPGFAASGNRLGVVSAHFPAKVKLHYVRVPVAARSSADAADFFARIEAPRFASKEMREFVQNVRTVLELFVAECKADAAAKATITDVPDVTNDGLWTLLKRFVILEFDYTQDHSRDRTAVLESLRQAISSQDLEDARHLYDRLEEIAREMAQTGGSHDGLSLQERVLAEGVALAPRPSMRQDYERLSDHADLVLSGIDSTIAGLSLDRGDLASEALAKVEAGQSIVLTGSAGLGKSAILRSIAEVCRAQGPIVALDGHRLNGVVGWNGLATTLRIESRLAELVLSLSGTAHPCLIIDGLDKIENSGGRQAVNDLLRAIARVPSGPNSHSRWTVIATVREESLDSLREWLDMLRGRTLAHVAVIRVPNLTDEDVLAVGERLPHLAPILARTASNVVLRNLYFLRTVEEFARAEPLDGPAALALVTEADIARVWWERLVGRDAARDRQQAMLSFGEGALADRSHRVAARGLDPRVIRSLEMDGIIRRDAETDTFWFSHDVLEEWTVARCLAQANDAIGRLKANGDPFWATGALQLYASSILERDGGVAWRELLTQAEEDASVPWGEVVLTAPFRSTRLPELLTQIGSVLREDDGRRLASFLRALRTRFIRPNPLLEKILQSQQMEAAERNALLLEMGIPWGPAWVPVLAWLAPQLSDLPWRAREEASRIMLAWQRTPIPGLPFRREIAEAALKWRAVLLHPSGERVFVSREAKPYFDRLRDVVAASAEAIPDLISEFLSRLHETESRDDLQRWVGRSQQVGLAQHAASPYVDFILDLLVPAWRHGPTTRAESEFSTGRFQSAFDEDEEWRHLNLYLGSAFIDPSQFRGPFLILLRANPGEGLRLITTLVNRATASYQRNQELHGGGREMPIVIHFQPRTTSDSELIAPDIVPSEKTAERGSDADALGGPLATNAQAESVASLSPSFLERQFNGDARVYQWFRPNSGAPYPVRSALMALEVWMEEQMDAGRDPVELFDAVLRGSDSVASVGVCVSIALAYPNQSLEAAAPFVGAPLVWEFDISRFASDRTGTFNVNALLGIDDSGDRHARDRDNRPQRRVDIRDLVPRYMFTANEKLRDRVLASVRGFPDDLSPLTPEERQNGEAVTAYRERIENYVALAEPTNYHWTKTTDGTDAIVFQPPQELEQRNAPVRERLNTMAGVLALQAWADETLSSGQASSRMTSARAILRAKAMQRDSDFSVPLSMDGDPNEMMRLDSIIGTAAAVALLSSSDAASNQDLPWSTELLVSAAKMPLGPHTLGQLAAATVLTRVAKGLMALVEARRANDDVRSAVLSLARRGEDKVIDAVFSCLRRAWDVDPLLCKNLVARELGLAAEPKRSSGWVADEYARAKVVSAEQREAVEVKIESDLRAGRTPTLELAETPASRNDQQPHVREPGSLSGAYWTTHVTRVLRSVPVERLADGSELEWTLRLTLLALDWTIAQCVLHNGRPKGTGAPFGFGWPDFLGEWLALLAVNVLVEEDAKSKVVEPLVASWPSSAELISGLLWGYTKHFLVRDEIPPVAGREWRYVATWIVTHSPAQHWRRRDREQQEAVDLLLHVRNGRAVLTSQWHKATDFVDVYELWVEHVVHDAHDVSTLLTFLNASGRHLEAQTAVDLLAKALEKIPALEARDEMWRELGGGSEMAQLLATLWEKHGSVIRAKTKCLREFVRLLDELSRAGDPLAAQLRSGL